jgi:soluble lytic murein transglycosylase
MYTRVVHRKYQNRKFSFYIIIILCFTFILPYIFYHYKHYFFNRSDFNSIINDAACRHNINPALLKAVIWQESRFKANIVGTHQEIGLMQIRPDYGAVTDWEQHFKTKIPCRGILFFPELNIEIGAWYLGRALRRWSSYKAHFELALSEYNAGLKGMKSWIPENHDDDIIENITIPSTKEYISGIMNKFYEYSQ